ncbi:MAG: lipoate--protein ligase family protein [Actinobacteria bacterium]|nr:lipoate--protein ligase family protein [Actinomycetota bacterium]
MSDWRFTHLRDSAESVHGRDLPAERAIWRASIRESALVLGSKQGSSIVDQKSCDADRILVVRRRSGGGAVFLELDQHLWVDLVIPCDDELWKDDVGRAMWWVGDLWADALAACEVADRDQLKVHRGGIERSSFFDSICFGGLGPGEVTLNGKKVVGISQRRTREMARFQCVVHRRWSSAAYRKYLLFENELPDIAVAEVSGLNQIADTLVELATSR